MNSNIEIDVLIDSAKKIGGAIFDVFYDWRVNASTGDNTEDNGIAQCISQMIICKINSLLLLSNGISIVPNKENFKIVDPTSMIAVWRSVYETICVFRNIFIMTDDEAERNILLNLWKIRGLNNRQEMHNIPDRYKQRQVREKQEIENLKEEIRKKIVKFHISKQAIN